MTIKRRRVFEQMPPVVDTWWVTDDMPLFELMDIVAWLSLDSPGTHWEYALRRDDQHGNPCGVSFKNLKTGTVLRLSWGDYLVRPYYNRDSPDPVEVWTPDDFRGWKLRDDAS